MKTLSRIEHLYPRKIAADILRIERMRAPDAGATSLYANAIDTAARFGADSARAILSHHARAFDAITCAIAL